MKREQCRSVLIVEDDEGIRETLKFAIELEGYQVFAAANGQEGLDLLIKISQPCLILLDLMMPVMDGWGFVEAVKKIERFVSIPIVVISAFTDEARSIRAESVLKKPVDLDVLSKAVNHWCKDKELER